MCCHVTDFNARNKSLRAKLLQQGYRYHKLRMPFSNFYRQHYELVSKFNVDLKTFLRHGLPNQNCTVILYTKRNLWVVMFFRKIIIRYKRIGYNVDAIQQSACLVFNPSTVNNYASLFNCTPVSRASDSMIVPT